MSKPYRTCEHCGANLDPDEACDCHESRGAPPVVMPVTVAQLASHAPDAGLAGEVLRQLGILRMAYALHLTRAGACRLAWLETAMDDLMATLTTDGTTTG